jgi:hypothetical protein
MEEKLIENRRSSTFISVEQIDFTGGKRSQIQRGVPFLSNDRLSVSLQRS